MDKIKHFLAQKRVALVDWSRQYMLVVAVFCVIILVVVFVFETRYSDVTDDYEFSDQSTATDMFSRTNLSKKDRDVFRRALRELQMIEPGEREVIIRKYIELVRRDNPGLSKRVR